MFQIRLLLRQVLRGTACAGAILMLSGAAIAAEELNIYNWGEYINPEVLKKFETETNIKVNLSTYSSNEEMLAKIQGGATGYDIVFPSVHMQDIMAKLGLLEKTDINQYEGFKNIDPAFLRAKSDPKGEYCLPYAWGTVGIMYNRTVLGKDITGWRDLIETAKAKNRAGIEIQRLTLAIALPSRAQNARSSGVQTVSRRPRRALGEASERLMRRLLVLGSPNHKPPHAVRAMI